MFFIFFQCFAKDEDIVQINYDDLIDIFFQNVINYNLEYSWYINESKWQNQIFEVFKLGFKYGFPFVSFFDSK